LFQHLNYAFATIGPTTFEVKLASTSEENLIRRLARLKTVDADLKVYIAIGGCAYNDPGPTQTTFSDLAQLEDAQKKFFWSLISFLSTYNLDGVDLDWEYPGPHDIIDRGGREEDFENFPIFLRRLKEALKSAGGRDGVTLTLPASYWFLQYFDIVKLEKHVNFFNIISYDLHGAWDKGNKWLGPYLNAHTNLTKISNALDLLWRNKIPSNKVVLGTAFYSRAFTATSTNCLEPGCTFESAATMGECSRENGILLNSEIMEIVKSQQLKPTFDKKAGVKIATWGNQWVAYNDEETLEIKAKFSLGLGLGGVMVWAVSHDTPSQRFSNAFFKRAVNQNGLTSMTETNSTRYIKTRKVIDQCKWTNCGDPCPAGYKPALRTDDNAAENEVMLEKTACDGDHHTLCCPETAMATCGWYIHTNSFCDYTCPRDFVEIGSNSHGCHSGYQAACCRATSNPIHSWSLSSMQMWGKCEWAGDRSDDRRDPDCSVNTCPSAARIDPELHSNAGSGAVSCEDDAKRLYCCAQADRGGGEGNQWLQGKWEDHLGQFLQDNKTRERCLSDCPDDTYRLAMEQTGVCKNKPGAKAYCAPNGHYDVEWKERANVTHIKESLEVFFNNPQCPNDQSGGLEPRDPTVHDAQLQVKIALSAILGKVFYERTKIKDYQDLWNEIADARGFGNLKFPELLDRMEEWFGNIYSNVDKMIEIIMCRFQDLNDLVSSNPALSCEDEDPCEDEDADCESEDWEVLCPEAKGSLDKRGAIRRYCIETRGTILRSRGYRSTGQVPRTDFLRRRVIVLRNRRDCSNTNVRQVSMPTGNMVDGQVIHGERVRSLGLARILTDYCTSRARYGDEFGTNSAQRLGSWATRRGSTECL
jgi:GH18 family chitinase